MIALIFQIGLVVGIVFIFISIFKRKDKGTKIKCDNCGYTLTLSKQNYEVFAMNGKICPSCKKNVNK